MTGTEIATLAIGGLCTIVTTLFIWFVQRRFNNLDKKREREYQEERELRKKEREEERELRKQEREEERKRQDAIHAAQRRENILVLTSLHTIGKLTYANSIAIKDHKVNGVMADALKNYEESRDELSDFLREQAVSSIHDSR